MIMKFLILLCYVLVIDAKSEKFFRKGYNYLEETKSFYKVHTIHKSWNEAKTICELEGATLFYPKDEEEARAVISHWQTFQKFKYVYIGISTPNVKEVFETVDGLPIEDVFDSWLPGEPNRAVKSCVILWQEAKIADAVCDGPYPFICKKTEASLRWNHLCHLPDPEYKFYENTGRCYKFHLIPKSWEDAYTTCNYEQSRLAVINSDEEAKILVDIVRKAPKELTDGDYLRDAVHLGFKYDNGWKTFQGTDLRGSGYAKWGKGKPEGGGTKSCGSMFYDGLLRDVTCDVKSFFICEHEVPILATGLDYKFGEENAVTQDT